MELNERQAELLNDYVEGTLSSSDQTEVDTLLREHPALAETVRQMREDRQTLQQMPVQMPLAGAGSLVEAAMTQMGESTTPVNPGQQQGSANRWGWRLAVGLSAAAVFGLLAGVVFTLLVDGSGQSDMLNMKVQEDQAIVMAEPSHDALLEKHMYRQLEEQAQALELDTGPVPAEQPKLAMFARARGIGVETEPLTIVTDDLPSTRRQLDAWAVRNAVPVMEDGTFDDANVAAGITAKPSDKVVDSALVRAQRHKSDSFAFELGRSVNSPAATGERKESQAMETAGTETAEATPSIAAMRVPAEARADTQATATAPRQQQLRLVLPRRQVSELVAELNRRSTQRVLPLELDDAARPPEATADEAEAYSDDAKMELTEVQVTIIEEAREE